MAKTKVTQTLILRVTYEIKDGGDYESGAAGRGRLGFFKKPIERLLNGKVWNEKLRNISWEVEHVSPLVEERLRNISWEVEHVSPLVEERVDG